MNVLVKQEKTENLPECKRKFSAFFQNIQIRYQMPETFGSIM